MATAETGSETFNVATAGQAPVDWRRHVRRWRLLPVAVALIALLGYEIAARTGLISIVFFPPPSAIVRTGYRMAQQGRLLGATLSSVVRLATGFLCGAVPAAVLGLCMGWSRRLRENLDPFVAALHPVPKTALLPLFMIIFGLGETSRLLVVALATFFPVLINCMAGVTQISPIHFEVAENYGASRLKIFLRVVLPGALPLALAGARVGLNTALALVIAVELLSASTGLGAMMWMAWETMRVEELYVGLVITAVVGILLNLALGLARHRLVPWQHEPMI